MVKNKYMKSIGLEPSKDNLMSTLKENAIGRNESVWKFAEFCGQQEGRCSIAIDSGWGSGKTFFVHHVKMLIDSYNEYIKQEDLDVEGIKIIFNEYIKHQENLDKERFGQDIADLPSGGGGTVKFQNEVCVYYDAWANDNLVDPMISLVYEIIQCSLLDYEFNTSTDFGKAVESIIDFFDDNEKLKKLKKIGNVISGAQSDEDQLKEGLDAIRKSKDVQQSIKDFFDSLLAEKGSRLNIIIDELDRCKPEFAVLVLERIKHYFHDDRITFVFSVNTAQLQHTIRQYYGEHFDASKYLDRFFDYRISLSPINLNELFSNIDFFTDETMHSHVCKHIIVHGTLELREIEKFYTNVKIAIEKYDKQKSEKTGIFKENTDDFKYSYEFIVEVIVPISVWIKMIDVSLYTEFINGYNADPLVEITELMDDTGIRNLAYSLKKEMIDVEDIIDKIGLRYKRIKAMLARIEEENDSYIKKHPFENFQMLSADVLMIGDVLKIVIAFYVFIFDKEVLKSALQEITSII